MTLSEPPVGTAQHVWGAIRHASWVLKYFGWLVIIATSGHYSLGYFNHPADWDYYIDKIFILSGFAVLLVGSIIREISRLRKERYANVFDRTEAINGIVRDITTYVFGKAPERATDKEQFKRTVEQQIESILDNVGEIFSMLTGTACRVSIKCMLNDGGKIFVYTLARDRHSASTNHTKDKKRLEERTDRLEDNEDFHSIFKEELLYYIQNDLPRRIDYRNSSFNVYGRRPQVMNWFQRTFTPGVGWPLPYRSAMVFPIEQKNSRVLQFDAPGCIGFLTVDSNFRNVFRERFDGPLGAGLASTLFIPLYHYRSALDASMKGNDND